MTDETSRKNENHLLFSFASASSHWSRRITGRPCYPLEHLLNKHVVYKTSVCCCWRASIHLALSLLVTPKVSLVRRPGLFTRDWSVNADCSAEKIGTRNPGHYSRRRQITSPSWHGDALLLHLSIFLASTTTLQCVSYIFFSQTDSLLGRLARSTVSFPANRRRLLCLHCITRLDIPDGLVRPLFFCVCVLFTLPIDRRRGVDARSSPHRLLCSLNKILCSRFSLPNVSNGRKTLGIR